MTATSLGKKLDSGRAPNDMSVSVRLPGVDARLNFDEQHAVGDNCAGGHSRVPAPPSATSRRLRGIPGQPP